MCVDNDDYDYDYDGDGDGSYSDLPPLFLVLLYGSDWRASNVLWIQSVYVDKAHRRKGYFRMLYEAAKRHAEQVGAAGFFFFKKKRKGGGGGSTLSITIIFLSIAQLCLVLSDMHKYSSL